MLPHINNIYFDCWAIRPSAILANIHWMRVLCLLWLCSVLSAHTYNIRQRRRGSLQYTARTIHHSRARQMDKCGVHILSRVHVCAILPFRISCQTRARSLHWGRDYISRFMSQCIRILCSFACMCAHNPRADLLWAGGQRCKDKIRQFSGYLVRALISLWLGQINWILTF